MAYPIRQRCLIIAYNRDLILSFRKTESHKKQKLLACQKVDVNSGFANIRKEIQIVRTNYSVQLLLQFFQSLNKYSQRSWEPLENFSKSYKYLVKLFEDNLPKIHAHKNLFLHLKLSHHRTQCLPSVHEKIPKPFPGLLLKLRVVNVLPPSKEEFWRGGHPPQLQYSMAGLVSMKLWCHGHKCLRNLKTSLSQVELVTSAVPQGARLKKHQKAIHKLMFWVCWFGFFYSSCSTGTSCYVGCNLKLTCYLKQKSHLWRSRDNRLGHLSNFPCQTKLLLSL